MPERHPDLLTRVEAATWVGMSPRYLDEVAVAGTIPVVRQGRRVFFWRRDLDAYLARCTSETGCSTSAVVSGGLSSSREASASASRAEREIERRLLSKLPGSKSSTPALLLVGGPAR